VSSQSPPNSEVDLFILSEIETVPHLEALLLIWNSRPQPWTVENLAQRLYISTESANDLLKDLVRRALVVLTPGNPEGYRYQSDSKEKDQLLAQVDDTYRRELVRVSRMIHSKPSAAVRAFARAFRITKERS
jgi:predicted ArsR family transcriptional regulator